MTTEFGQNMKNVMELIAAKGDGELSVKKANATKERVITYEFSASGVDLEITRKLNGKETRKLVLYISQDSKDGGPVIAILEKGEVYEATESKIKSFMDGVQYNLNTGCTAIPMLRSDKKNFVNALEVLKNNPDFLKLTRMGVMDTDLIITMGEKGYGNNIGRLWFLDREAYYYRSFSNLGEVNLDNIHIKMVRRAIEYNMSLGMDYNKALRAIYSDMEYNQSSVFNGRKVIFKNVIEFFIVMANRYDEPFAIKCMDEYLDNDNLDSVDATIFDRVLRIRNGAKYDDNYGNYEKSYVNADLKQYRLTSDQEAMVIQFEKNRLWEYIQESIAVGKGKDIGGYIGLWKDWILMTQDMVGVLKDKYPEMLQIAHDICQEKYKLNKDDDLSNRIHKATEEYSKMCDVDIEMGSLPKNWQFRILRTPGEFSDEAVQQNNCVASYMNRCANGETIVGSLRPKGSATTVITIEVSMDGEYNFIQIKGRFNKNPTQQQWEIIHKVEAKIKNRLRKVKKGESIEDDNGKEGEVSEMCEC